MPKKKTAATKQKKLPRIKPINNFALLMVLSVFQLLSGTAALGGFSVARGRGGRRWHRHL